MSDVELPPFESEDGWEIYEDVHSVADFNDYYLGLLESYVTWRHPRASFERHVDDILQHPYLAKTVIKNWTTDDAEKWQMWIDCLALPKPRSRINLFVGSPGSGKSTIVYDTAYCILERSGRPVVEVGDSNDTPDFVTQIDHISEAPFGAVVIDNELALNAASDNANTKEGKAIKPALATIRHNDCIGLFVSQNSGLANRAFYALADTLVFKPLGLTQARSERGPMKHIIAYWKELLPRNPGETFILSKYIPPLKIKRDAPDWYTDQMSRAYVRFSSLREALPHAIRLRQKNRSYEKISNHMAGRWQYHHHERWREWILAANRGIDPLTGKPPGAKARAKAASEQVGVR